jgi:hypothetical protein
MLEKHPDWLTFLQSKPSSYGDELPLETLRTGDLLIVVTSHTRYALHIIEGRSARLETDRPDRPSGQARINGCTFGMSSSIKPNHLFCGGNLELSLENGRITHNTTEIQAIHLIRRGEPQP